MSEDNSRAGYVYVLEFSETQVKIGKTTREPDERAGEWELPLLHYAWAEDCHAAERAAHEQLCGERHGAYEVFSVPVDVAIKVVNSVCGGPSFSYSDLSWSHLLESPWYYPEGYQHPEKPEPLPQQAPCLEAPESTATIPQRAVSPLPAVAFAQAAFALAAPVPVAEAASGTVSPGKSRFGWMPWAAGVACIALLAFWAAPSRQDAPATPASLPPPVASPTVPAPPPQTAAPKPAATVVQGTVRAARQQPAQANEQIVTTTRLNLRAEPDAAGRLLRTLEPGTAVTVLERRGDWARVEGGWVSSRYLGP